jgi:hypothetical protein
MPEELVKVARELGGGSSVSGDPLLRLANPSRRGQPDAGATGVEALRSC